MHYENPKIPEGINVSTEHPLKEFAQLLIGALVVVVILATALALLAEHLVRYVPFEMEVEIAAKYPASCRRAGPLPNTCRHSPISSPPPRTCLRKCALPCITWMTTRLMPWPPSAAMWCSFAV
jgi:hypothetical protein